jgi:hypothetical protein
MKNLILTFILLMVVFSLNAQVVVFTETGVSSIGGNQHIGIKYIKKDSKIGFYGTIGGNVLERMIGMNNNYVSDVKGDLTSTVSWYTKNGTHYPIMPNIEIFTSPDWGNRLLETGTCVNTLETWSGEVTTTTNIYNLGVVIKSSKNNKIKYRIGAGVRKLSQVGYRDYNYWQRTFNVNKYYDEWGTVQPNNVFVVEGSGSVREWDDMEYVSITKNEFNVNFAVDYETLTSFCFSFGFNTKGGINVGFGFPLF